MEFKDLMWQIFRSTGSINAYMLYRDTTTEDAIHSQPEGIEERRNVSL